MHQVDFTKWAERPAEKPGAILPLIRVHGAASDFYFILFYPRVNFQYRLSGGVRAAPFVQSHASASVRALTIPTGPTKILHTVIEMGSAALAAAVSYPGKATPISRDGQ